MVEIKFRVWDSNHSFMTDDVFIEGDGYVYEAAGKTYDTPHTEIERCSFEVMQYTGIKDKNGIEIYKDDLMQNKSGRICQVVWHKHSGCWDAEVVKAVGDSDGGEAVYWHDHMEVIGNIYANPELRSTK